MFGSIHITIAEHDIRTRKHLAQYLAAQHGVVIHASVNDGRDALFQLKNQPPDVFITEIILPGYDGFALLEAMSEDASLNKVKTIVLTSLAQDQFVERALSLGAYYFMCKPYDVSILYRRIVECMVDHSEQPPPDDRPQDTRYLKELLRKNGIPESAKGFSYIQAAVLIGSGMKVLNGRITKELYPEVARIHGTTSKNVERAIRNALARGFGKSASAPGTPSNGEYIARLIHEMKNQ